MFSMIFVNSYPKQTLSQKSRTKNEKEKDARKFESEKSKWHKGNEHRRTPAPDNGKTRPCFSRSIRILPCTLNKPKEFQKRVGSVFLGILSWTRCKSRVGRNSGKRRGKLKLISMSSSPATQSSLASPKEVRERERECVCSFLFFFSCFSLKLQWCGVVMEELCYYM